MKSSIVRKMLSIIQANLNEDIDISNIDIYDDNDGSKVINILYKDSLKKMEALNLTIDNK